MRIMGPRIGRRPGRRAGGGVSTIIATILLVALTIVAGTLLWTFHFSTPPAPPNVAFNLVTGGSNPVWGDPTDCQPQGHWTYPLPSSQYDYNNPTTWGGLWAAQCYPDNLWTGAPQAPTGNFSLLNTSQIIFAAHSPSIIPISEIEFTFVCNNATNSGGTTVLLQGSLAEMAWYPGVSTLAPANAPTLGWCGNFNASNFGGGAYGTAYNRLGMFIPLYPNATLLQNGDTFLLYIHNGGWPLDYQCVDPDLYGFLTNGGNPVLDNDDYHGAPPWCFLTPSACTIYITYTGDPQTTLAEIPVYELAPAP